MEKQVMRRNAAHSQQKISIRATKKSFRSRPIDERNQCDQRDDLNGDQNCGLCASEVHGRMANVPESACIVVNFVRSHSHTHARACARSHTTHRTYSTKTFQSVEEDNSFEWHSTADISDTQRTLECSRSIRFRNHKEMVPLRRWSLFCLYFRLAFLFATIGLLFFSSLNSFVFHVWTNRSIDLE